VPTMLVTVAGPSGRRDLSLPADAPVAELLPVLVRLVGDELPAAGRWTLAPAGGQPLAEDASLAAAGVLHGALLRLAVPAPPRPAVAAPPAPPPLPSDGRTPSERTAAALPPRRPLAERARLTAGRVGGPLDRLRRARETWRSTSYLELLDAAVQRPILAAPARVAVTAAQAGAGVSTVTGLLGTLLALLRQDRVVAVDAGEGPGSLCRALGLHEELPAGSRYPLVLLDCGAGLASQPGQALVRACEQLVLVTGTDPASASLAVEAALPLTRAGLAVTMVVNRMPAGGGRLDLDQLGRYLPDARGLVAIPDAPAAADELATGAFTWQHAPARWRRAVRELTASLVADWPRLGLAR
jgi:MinD-like ATPase involved in chromosome partitioning or flagellar assembly